MKKLITLCLAMLFIVQNTQATSNSSTELIDGSITGKVLDATLNEPLPYVNIIIKNDKGDIITGAITLDDGTFKITKIPEGKITVTAQYIGYKSVVKELTISRKNRKFDLGDIRLEEEASSLDEITVVAEVSTIQQKVDRKVINIGKDLAASGTASELMVGVPSVNVDAQTGDISLRGNQNVQVLVDGKLSNIPTAQLLKQIPSTSIKQIELITNPSAKYNPEGMSGIINIVLHKNLNIGFNGSANVGLSYELEPKFNSSIDMNYRNGKLNFYGSYSTNISDNRNTGLLNQTEADISQTFNFLDERNSHLFKVGVDFYIDDKNTFSVFTNQNLFDGGTLGETQLIYNNNLSNNQLQTFDNFNDNNSEQYNVNYKLDFDKEGHNIELEADYNAFDSDLTTYNTFTGGNARPNFDELTNTERNRTTINLDYVNPISETTKLELGLQARLFNNSIAYNSDARVRNEFGTYIPTQTLFDYERNIYSAYASYSKKINKWTYQLGLRVESVQVDALALDTDLINNTTTNFPFENDYIQVYPSAFVTFNPSEKNSYQFSFSRRVDRPGVGQVNPIPEFNTPLISQFGNPELKPQFTNSIEANYTRNLKKGSITGGVFYRLIEDEINQGVFVDRSDLASGRVILTNDNFDNTTAYGVEVSSNYRPTKWWSINASFDLYARKQTGFAESLDPTIENPVDSDVMINNVEVKNVIYNFRMFNNFRVNKKLTFTAFAMYRGKDTGLNFEMEAMYFANLGMRYNFLEDNRATFSLNFNNVFDTQEINILSERPFRQTVNFMPEFNTVFAGLSYRFGGGKYRAKSRKRRDNDEKQGGGIL